MSFHFHYMDRRCDWLFRNNCTIVYLAFNNDIVSGLKQIVQLRREHLFSPVFCHLLHYEGCCRLCWAMPNHHWLNFIFIFIINMHKNKSKIILKTKNICFSVTFCRSSFFLFFLIIVLSVLLQFTASDSSFC
jgi:hypothetical protein